MRVSIFLFLFSFLLIFYFAYSDDPVPCRFNDGTFGKCVDIRNCKSLYDLYKLGTIRVKDLPICDPVKRLVCCPRISAKKCKEYGRSVVETVRTSLLMTDNSRDVVLKSKCQHKGSGLIVGGTEAGPFEFPHQALLGYQINDETKYICGGTLISPDFVLTAAHCISSIEYGAVKYVKLAVHDRSYDGSKTVTFTVKQTFKYSNTGPSHINDIALLKLQGAVDINEYILPACLPTRPYYNREAVVTGFGETGRGVLSGKLLKVVLEKFSQEDCDEIYGEKFNETMMLCYGHRIHKKDSCTGDSGGPLQISNDEQVNCTYTQIGIVSFGTTQCGVVGAPGVYVNVYKYLDWIEGIVWKDEV